MAGAPFMDRIASRWTSIAATFEDLRRAAEADVTAWRFALPYAAEGHLQPLYAERRDGTRLTQYDSLDALVAATPHFDPEHDTAARLGYDAAGRLRIVDDGSVEVLVHGDGFVESYELAPGGGSGWDAQAPELNAVRRQTLTGGRVTAVHELRAPSPASGGDGWSWETYAYDEDGRLAEVRTDGGTVERVEWTADGVLERIVADGPNGEQVLWRCPPADLRSVVDRVEEALVDAVVRWAAGRWPANGAFALAIGTGGRWSLPPTPVLLTAAEFEAQLRTSAERGSGVLGAWAPQGYERWGAADFTALLSPAAHADVRMLMQEWGPDDDAYDAHGWDLVERVAVALSQRDWTPLPGGEALIVYLVDFEDDGSIPELLEVTVPPERLADLRRRGLLPPEA